MKKELKSGILSADKSADHRLINRPTVAGVNDFAVLRPRIKSCVFQVTRPCLNFYPGPNFFKQFKGISKGFSQSAILFPYHSHVKTFIKIENISYLPALF